MVEIGITFLFILDFTYTSMLLVNNGFVASDTAYLHE